MAWQSYVDNMVAQQVLKGGIYSLEGAPWHDTTKDCSIKASPTDMTKLISAIKAGPGLSSIEVEGQEYSVINIVQDEFALAKTKGGAAEDKGLLYCATGKNFAMIGFKKGAGERDVVKVVDKLKDHINNSM